MKEIITIPTLAEIDKAAQQFLKMNEGKRLFAFNGKMGAGKTTFIKALCTQLGVKDTISSPTFSIVNEYRSGNGSKIFHFDFYRLKSEVEAMDMGYEDYFYSNAICFIEWPEKISGLLPSGIVVVDISVQGDKRVLSIFSE